MLLLCPEEIVIQKSIFNLLFVTVENFDMDIDFILGVFRGCNVDLDIDTTLTCMKTEPHKFNFYCIKIEPQTLNFIVCCTYIYYMIMRGRG